MLAPMRGLALVCLLAGCSYSRWAVVGVRGPDGAPLAETTVSVVCRPLGSAARLTGADGIAALELRNARGDRCLVTATREGFATKQAPTDARCKARAGCPPIELVLEGGQ